MNEVEKKWSFVEANRAYAECYFWKGGKITSEEIVLQLVSSKCLTVLLYSREACGLN